MTKQEARQEAERLIERDDDLVYDACANIGQMADNLPHGALVRIVAAFLMEN